MAGEYPILDAARAIIRAHLDLYHAQHGHPRPVTICDLDTGYHAAWRAMGYPRAASPGAGAPTGGRET